MTAFYVIGALTATWAVLVAGLGIKRHRFPETQGATRIVMGISAAFMVATVLSAVIGASLEEEEHGAEEAAAAEPGASGDETAGQTLELAAVPSGDFAFTVEMLEAEPGTVTLAMANPSDIPHNVSIEGQGVSEEGETVPEGGTSTVTAEVEPGQYAYYCSVAGHREGGMEGTLVVGGAAGGGEEPAPPADGSGQGGGGQGGGGQGGGQGGGEGQGGGGGQGGGRQGGGQGGGDQQGGGN